MTASLLDVFVPGKAEPKGSATALPAVHRFPFVARCYAELLRAVRVTNDNPKAKSWAAAISLMARGARTGSTPVAGPVWVELDFYLQRPKAHAGARGLRPSAPAFHTTRPDTDKLTRCALDALTGVVFDDDGQVVEIRARKWWADGGVREGVRIVVRDNAGSVTEEVQP